VSRDELGKRAEEERERLRQAYEHLVLSEPAHHDGRIDGLARARGESTDRRGGHQCQPSPRWLTRDCPDVEEARAAAARIAKDAIRAADIAVAGGIARPHPVSRGQVTHQTFSRAAYLSRARSAAAVRQTNSSPILMLCSAQTGEAQCEHRRSVSCPQARRGTCGGFGKM